MPVFKRELAFESERPAENSGDWWHLVLDTAAPGLYVEHSWIRMSPHLNSEVERGSERFGINDFLTLAEGRSAQPMLVNALKEMFRTTHQAADEDSGERDSAV